MGKASMNIENPLAGDLVSKHDRLATFSPRETLYLVGITIISLLFLASAITLYFYGY